MVWLGTKVLVGSIDWVEKRGMSENVGMVGSSLLDLVSLNEQIERIVENAYRVGICKEKLKVPNSG